MALLFFEPIYKICEALDHRCAAVEYRCSSLFLMFFSTAAAVTAGPVCTTC
jgi:hypothetical protein